MSKPTDAITWATDAAFAADGDAWGGDTNKADPGAMRRAEGAEPDTFPAVWFNHIMNGIGNVLTWLLARFDSSGQVLTDGVLGFGRYVSAVGCDQPGTWTVTPVALPGFGISMGSTANNAYAWWDITKHLPRGAEVLRVRALVTPGVARATQADRMSLEVYVDSSGTFSAPSVSASAVVLDDVGASPNYDDGTTNAQWITLLRTGTPMAVSDFDVWIVGVQASVGGGATANRIHTINVEFQTSLISND